MSATLIKSTLLIVLIVVIVVAGLLVFDWIGLVSLRQDLAPVLRLVGLDTTSALAAEESSLNDSRLRQQLESLELQRQNLEAQEQKLNERSDKLNERERALTQAEEQLQQQLQSLEERENLYRARNSKVEQVARNFNGMPPAQAVAQMNQMDALLVVDLLRAADRIAAEENTASLVSFWISQMPPERGAEINQLLVEKP